MAKKNSITVHKRRKFLEKLKETGRVTDAAAATGTRGYPPVSRRAWYDLRDRDEDFKQEWDDAERAFFDYIESVAIDRAVNGVIKSTPYVHYDGDEKETKFYDVAYKSDRLLELTLKSRHPLYKPTIAQEITNPDGSLTPPSDEPDWSKLSNTELQTLVELQRKLHAGQRRA